MKFALKVCILAALLSLWTWGVLIEPYFMLDCENVEIKLPKWDDKLDGLKIALVSDIHVGAGPLENWRMTQIVKKTNAAKPDIILLLGDYVNAGPYYSKMEMSRLSAYLRRLKAPLGVYSILGNHDSYFGVHLIRKMLSDGNVILIENSNKKISTPKGDFYLAGIADPVTQNYFYRADFRRNSARRARRLSFPFPRRVQGNPAGGKRDVFGTYARRTGQASVYRKNRKKSEL